ncbi:MAG: hypothetical protein GYA23_04035 [Methanomicrobiales archaeon]|nr:hypothetical protein [Methanomicrobiales archaeon]
MTGTRPERQHGGDGITRRVFAMPEINAYSRTLVRIGTGAEIPPPLPPHPEEWDSAFLQRIC